MSRKFKIIVCFTLFLTLCFSVFADNDSIRTFFPSLSTESVYPLDSDIGQIYPANFTSSHELLSKALSESFDFNWTEKYLASQSKKNLTTLYSGLLSELLPSNMILFSKSVVYPDNSVSLSVKFLQNKTVLTFVLLNNQIIGITAK